MAKKNSSKKVAKRATKNPAKVKTADYKLTDKKLDKEPKWLDIFRTWALDISNQLTDIQYRINQLQNSNTDVDPSDMGQTELFPDTDTEAKAATVTKEDVTQALQKVSAAHGLGKVKEVLDSFEATNITTIKEDDYSSFIEACVDLTAVPAQTEADFLS